MPPASKRQTKAPVKTAKDAPKRARGGRAATAKAVVEHSVSASSSDSDDNSQIIEAMSSTRTTATVVRDPSVTVIADESDIVTVAGTSSTNLSAVASESLAKRPSVLEVALSCFDTTVESDEETVTATTMRGEDATRAVTRHVPQTAFDQDAMDATVERLQTRLMCSSDQFSSSSSFSTNSILSHLIHCSDAQAFFRDGFRLTMTRTSSSRGIGSDEPDRFECNSLRDVDTPRLRRSRSASHRSDMERRHPPPGPSTRAESFLEPTATSLYRSSYAQQSRSTSRPPAQPTVPAVNEETEAEQAVVVPASLRHFLQEQLQMCYACEDALMAARRRAETREDCEASLAAQQLYQTQHPPCPKNMLCLRTGKRWRVGDERGDGGAPVGLRSAFEVDAPELSRSTASGAPSPTNVFDVMATHARQQHEQQLQARARREVGPTDSAVCEATVQTLQLQMQQAYRDQWRVRDAAEHDEDEARAVRRLQELPVLIDDAVHYAHQVLLFQAAASPSASSSVTASGAQDGASPASPSPPPSASTTTATTVGQITYGDSTVPLYGRYPPPLFRTTPFTAETVRLLKWLRTWRRQGQSSGNGNNASGSGSNNNNNSGDAGMSRRTGGRPHHRSTQSARLGTATEEALKNDKQVPAAEKTKANMTVEKATAIKPATDLAMPSENLALPTSITTAPTVPVAPVQTKQSAFLSFFGAAAKTVKKESEPVKVESAVATSSTAVSVKQEEVREAETDTRETTTASPGSPGIPTAVVVEGSRVSAEDLYRRRWQQAVRHPSSFSSPTMALPITAAPPPRSELDGSAASSAASPSSPPSASRAVRGLPFFAEMVEEQQDGALLGSTAEAYSDAFGNRLRSARLAQKEVERRVAEEAARRKLAKKTGYFAREADGLLHSRGVGAGVGGDGRATTLDALLSRRMEEEAKKREQARRRRRHRRHRASRSASSASSSSSSSSTTASSSNSDTDDTSTSGDEKHHRRRQSGGGRRATRRRSHSASSICTVSSNASSSSSAAASACSVGSQTSASRASSSASLSSHKRRQRAKPSAPRKVPSRRERGASLGAKKTAHGAHPANPATAQSSKAKSPSDAVVGGDDDITNIAVVSGPCGSGKSASVYLAAYLLGYRVVEMNASVKRNPKNVELLLAELTRSHRLSGLPQGRSTVSVEEELSKLKREHEALQERIKAEAAAADAEAERKRREARRANAISANAVAAFFKSKPQPASHASTAAASDDVAEIVQIEDVSPDKSHAKGDAHHEALAASSGELVQSRTAAASVPGGSSASSVPSMGTLLLFEDADVLLEDESYKPFYAAIRDLAHKSKVPIVVTVTTPSSPSVLSAGAAPSGSSRRVPGPSLPLLSPRYPLEVPAFTTALSSASASLGTSGACTGDDRDVLAQMEEARLRFTDELSSTTFTQSTFTHVPFNGAAAAGFFGRQTPFTQLSAPSRATLFVQLLLVGAAELQTLELVPEPIEAPRDVVKQQKEAPQLSSLTDLCDRLLASSVESARAAAATTTTSPRVLSTGARLVVHIRPGRVQLLRTLAKCLQEALFGSASRAGTAASKRVDNNDADSDDTKEAALDDEDARLAEASTSDVRFWHCHLQMLLLTLTQPPSSSVHDTNPEAASPVHGESASVTRALARLADCDEVSRWDRQRGRYHGCLAVNDAECPRQRCWELSALFDYDEDITEALATVHHPTLHVAYDTPSVFEQAAAEKTTRKQGKHAATATARSTGGGKGRGKSKAPITVVHDEEATNDDDEDDEDVVVAPQRGVKRGRGRPPLNRPTATINGTPLSCASSTASVSPSLATSAAAAAATTAKSSIWSFFTPPKASLDHTPHSPPSLCRRTEAVSVISTGSTNPAVSPDGNAVSAPAVPPSMFSDCATLFTPRPVELVLPYGPTQRLLFPSRGSLETASPAWAENSEERLRLQRWRPLLADRPRAASVMGLSPSGHVVAESALAQLVASPYVRVAGTQETSVAQRMAVLRRWWRRPRKADAAKKLVPGQGLDALEDLLGFSTTLMAPPRT